MKELINLLKLRTPTLKAGDSIVITKWGDDCLYVELYDDELDVYFPLQEVRL